MYSTYFMYYMFRHVQFLQLHSILKHLPVIQDKAQYSTSTSAGLRHLRQPLLRPQSQGYRVTRTSTRGNCRIPKQSTTFSQYAFSYKAIKTWNGLSSSLKALAASKPSHLRQKHGVQSDVFTLILI